MQLLTFQILALEMTETTSDTQATDNRKALTPATMTFDEMLEHSRRQMEQVQPSMPTRVAFTWCNRNFTAHIDEAEKDAVKELRVRIIGDFGPIPFTAEDRSGRTKVTKLIEWHGDFGDFRLVATARNRMSIIGMRHFKGEADGLSLLSALVTHLSEMAPFVQIAEEICNAAGMSNPTPSRYN